MLLGLSIRDLVIVAELELEFGAGFTVLTGATGAGKSILIDALLLALGERGDADLVREGAARAEVTAAFRVTPEACDWLAERDLAADGERLLLRRVVDSAGRSKAYVNGTPTTLAQLRELGALLVDVHGQHAHQSLLEPAAQMHLLDDHGKALDSARAVAAAWQALVRARRARDAAQALAAGAREQQERLRWIVDELLELAPLIGEWDAVQAEHKRLANAADLLDGARGALDTLLEADDATVVRLAGVATRVAQLATYDPRLAPIGAALDAARIQADDAARELAQYLDRVDLDDSRLALVEARVAALHAAGRKLRCAPEALPQLLESSRAELEVLGAAADVAQHDAAVAAALAQYDTLAQALSAQRAAAARSFAREVTRAMQDLAMPGGRLAVELEACAPSATGNERVEFRVAGHPGVTPRALARAKGITWTQAYNLREREKRLAARQQRKSQNPPPVTNSLAIAVIAASATPVATLIFDEVDAGIGGAVAETVGRLLEQLGRMRQVLCVTHLAQVAARGNLHYVVDKSTDPNGRPVARVTPLDQRQRVDEIARMLGGIELTETSRRHALEMLTLTG